MSTFSVTVPLVVRENAKSSDSLWFGKRRGAMFLDYRIYEKWRNGEMEKMLTQLKYEREPITSIAYLYCSWWFFQIIARQTISSHLIASHRIASHLGYLHNFHTALAWQDCILSKPMHRYSNRWLRRTCCGMYNMFTANSLEFLETLRLRVVERSIIKNSGAVLDFKYDARGATQDWT